VELVLLFFPLEVDKEGPVITKDAGTKVISDRCETEEIFLSMELVLQYVSERNLDISNQSIYIFSDCGDSMDTITEKNNITNTLKPLMQYNIQ